MRVQEHYDSLDSKGRRELLLKIGETPEEAQELSQRDYVALGGWVKTRLKRYWKKDSARLKP
jgi:hypothetical protein